MDIRKKYQETIQKLKDQTRPNYKFSNEEFSYLSKQWQNYLTEQDKTNELKQLLCLLDHTQNQSDQFDSLISQNLINFIRDSQLIIFTLGVAQKHIILRKQKMGERIPSNFIKSLSPLLKHTDYEVIEWTLRTITQLGRQSVLLKNDIINARPHFFAKFNSHAKACHQIINLLEENWS